MTNSNPKDVEAAIRWSAIAFSEYKLVPDVVYKKASGIDLKLDIVMTGPPNEPRRTVMYIHGGGWVECCKEDHALFTLPFLARGMNVVNVEYRMASQALAPAAVEDCRCALRWVSRHAHEYGIDLQKLVICGESAGGHLSLITSMLTPEDGFDYGCPANEPPGGGMGKAAAVIAFCPISDVAELLTQSHPPFFAVMWFGSMDRREELARRVSPLSYVRPNLPPMLIIHGDQDEYVPYTQSVRLCEQLSKAQVPNSLITISGGKHWQWPREEHFRIQTRISELLAAHGVL